MVIYSIKKKKTIWVMFAVNNEGSESDDSILTFFWSLWFCWVIVLPNSDIERVGSTHGHFWCALWLIKFSLINFVSFICVHVVLTFLRTCTKKLLAYCSFIAHWWYFEVFVLRYFLVSNVFLNKNEKKKHLFQCVIFNRNVHVVSLSLLW